MPDTSMRLMLMLAAALWPLAQSPRVGDLEERAIHRAVLQDGRCSGRGGAGAKGDRPVLQQELLNPKRASWWEFAPPPSLAERLPSMMPGLRAALLQEFLKVNETPSRWSREAGRELGADVVSRAELERIAKDSWFWDGFFRRFPSASALVELSRAAIDPAVGEALVYCGSSTNSLAGRGYLVLLRRSGDGWAPAYWQELWEA